MIGLLIVAVMMFMILPVLYVVPGFVLLVQKTRFDKVFLLLFIIALSMPILRYIPTTNEDATDHYYTAFLLSKFDNIVDAFRFIYNPHVWVPYDYHNFPLYTLLLYLFSDIKRYSIISFIVCIITYFCYLQPLNWLYRKQNISKFMYSMAFMAILLQNNIRFTASGMRYVVSHAIVFFLMYFDFSLEKKSKFYGVLYLIPILIHPSTIMVIVLRAMFNFLKRVNPWSILSFIVLYPMAVEILPFISKLLNIRYISQIAEKMDNYSSNEFYAIYFSKSVQIRIVVGVIFTLLYIYIYLRHSKKFEGLSSKMIDMTYYLSVLSLGMVFYLNLIDRILFISLPCIILSLVIIYSYEAFQTRANFILITGWLTAFILLGIIYNYNYPIKLLDFTWKELLFTNFFDFIRDIPVYFRFV